MNLCFLWSHKFSAHFTCTLSLSVFAFAPSLLLFSNSGKDNVKDILKGLVPIMSVQVIADSIRFNILQQLRALGDHNGPTAISVCGLLFGIVLADILRLNTSMGIYGVATGATSGVILAAAGLMYRWCSRIQPDKIKGMTESPSLAEPDFSFANCTATLFSRCRKNNVESGKNNAVLEPLSSNSNSALMATP